MEDEVVLLSSNINSNSNSNNTSSSSYTKIIKRRNATSSFSAIDHRKSYCCYGGTNKRCSRLITKHKQQAPKIRIIHIIPPEIIQTDKANFRNLVQSLTGRTSSSSTAKKLHRPQVSSSSCQNKSCFSRNIRLDRNERSSDDQLFYEFDHEVVSFTGGFQRNDFWDKLRMTKIEEDEMVVEAAVGAKWELKDKTECGFRSEGLLELGEGFLQEIDYSPLISPLGSNWEIDLFGEF
ncbi:hypothetical protein QQ045_005819 [Rhodiola kirilowii]